MLSKTSEKIIKETEMNLLASFEIPFYALVGPTMEYHSDILSNLCEKIRQNGNHACRRCTAKTEGQKEDKAESSDEAIMEE